MAPFDPESLTWPWRHRDARVDALQTAVMRIAGLTAARSDAFDVFDAHCSVPAVTGVIVVRSLYADRPQRLIASPI